MKVFHQRERERKEEEAEYEKIKTLMSLIYHLASPLFLSGENEQSSLFVWLIKLDFGKAFHESWFLPMPKTLTNDITIMTTLFVTLDRGRREAR